MTTRTKANVCRQCQRPLRQRTDTCYLCRPSLCPVCYQPSGKGICASCREMMRELAEAHREVEVGEREVTVYRVWVEE